jgi:hypothetical protein
MEKNLAIIQGLTSTDQANPIRITDQGELKIALYALDSTTNTEQPLEIEPDTTGASLGQLKVALYGYDSQNSIWRQLAVDPAGELTDGGSRVNPRSGGDVYSYGNEYSTIAAAVAGIQTLRSQLYTTMNGDGMYYIYDYAENVFGLGTKFYVTVSAVGVQ